LHIPHLVGVVVDPVTPLTETTEESTTMTPNEIIAHRRRRLLALADELGNVAEACRQMGVSRTRYYEWKRQAQMYGLEALTPKPRRRPQLSNETPTHVTNELLTLAVTEPTIGARQYADRLFDRGFSIAKTTVQKILNAHGLGRRRDRVAKAAAIVSMTTGLVTDAARDGGPFGFCHFAARPGDLVAMDGFYIGHLKGVGKVYQLTAIDTATRVAIVMILIGPIRADDAIAFVDHVVRRMRRLGVSVRGILSDNGPEWVATGLRAHLVARGIAHHRIPPRSPNHNAVCERFHGTILQECWRPAFHRRRFTSVRQLQGEADSFLVTYNNRRRNHSDFMRGRTPREVLDSHLSRRAS
jgi:transposase InsO family protein